MTESGAINRASILKKLLFIELKGNHDELFVVDKMNQLDTFKYIYSFGAKVFESMATIESTNMGVSETTAEALDKFNGQIAQQEGDYAYTFEPYQLRLVSTIELKSIQLSNLEATMKDVLKVESGKFISKKRLVAIVQASNKTLSKVSINEYLKDHYDLCEPLVAKKGQKKLTKIKNLYNVSANGIYEYESIKKETKKDLNKLTGMVYNVSIDKDNGSEVLYLMDEDGTKVGNVATERNTVNFDELNGMGTSILGTWMTVNYRLKHWSNEATHHSKNYFSVTDVYLTKNPTKAQKELMDKAISYYRDAYNWTTYEPTRNPKPSAMATVNYYDLSSSKRAKELHDLLESTK